MRRHVGTRDKATCVTPRDPCAHCAGIWVKPGREREALTAILMQEGCIPVWIDPLLVGVCVGGEGGAWAGWCSMG